MDTVTEVSAGTTEPVVAPATTVDPIEAKIATAVQEALKKQEPEIARRIQSEADKRVEPLRRRLTEAESRAKLLEGTLQTLPHALGPDADPAVVQRLQNQGLQANVNYYRQREQQEERDRREQEAKDMVLNETREEIAELGLNPDDPRLVYDLSQPDAKSFRRKVLGMAREALKEDSTKTIAQIVKEQVAAEAARIRKDSGVDSHDTETAVGKPTFNRAQFKDRKFYEKNREAMDLAVKEGRIQ